MNSNARIARELVKIAKMLIAFKHIANNIEKELDNAIRNGETISF